MAWLRGLIVFVGISMLFLAVNSVLVAINSGAGSGTGLDWALNQWDTRGTIFDWSSTLYDMQAGIYVFMWIFEACGAIYAVWEFTRNESGALEV